MNAVSLFSGVGGLDLGFEAAGIDIAAQVEWDAACQRVLAERFPDVPRWSDVRDVDADELRRIVGRADIVAGGSPCQDLSVAGKRAGLAGLRSGLYAEFVRLADALDPDWLVFENVAGLLSSNNGHDFGILLGDFTGWEPAVPDGGWRSSGVCVGPVRSAAWRVLDSQHFGVPQRRRRVFVVCHSRDRAAPAAVLLEPEGSTGNPPPGGCSWTRTARRAAAGTGDGRVVSTLQAGGGDRGYRIDAEAAAGGQLIPLAKCLTASERWDAETETLIPHRVTHALTAEGHDASEDGTGRGTPLVPWMDTAATLTAGVSSDGVSAPGRRQEDEHNLVPVAVPLDLRNALRTDGETGVGTPGTGVGEPGDPAGSVSTAGGGAVCWPLAVRGREDGAQLEIGPEDGPYNALRAADGGSSRTPMIATAFHENQRGELTGSLKTGGGKPGQGYPAAIVGAAVRRLTPLECERLQGWPDNHTLVEKTSDSARYKQAGNGITANVAEWIAWRLKAYTEGWRP